MKIYEISSEKELTKILDALYSKGGSIFRGQENKDFYLQPGLFRENDSGKIFCFNQLFKMAAFFSITNTVQQKNKI